MVRGVLTSHCTGRIIYASPPVGPTGPLAPSRLRPGGFSVSGPKSSRTSFLVDGFNVYHSARAASRDLDGDSTKWLDLRSLLQSFLSVVGPGAQLKDIYYFTALAHHLDHGKPGTTARHGLYMECLRATGVRIELGRFKYKTGWCDRCRQKRDLFEEKETDVAISVKLLELFQKDECDTAVLVTGDTDLAPAIRASSRMFPGKTVCVAFPYKRMNNELAKLVDTSFRIRKERYSQHQLPDPFTLSSGGRIDKPLQW
jgi:uncharacterized LabA/DUF88 family protein